MASTACELQALNHRRRDQIAICLLPLASQQATAAPKPCLLPESSLVIYRPQRNPTRSAPPLISASTSAAEAQLGSQLAWPLRSSPYKWQNGRNYQTYMKKANEKYQRSSLDLKWSPWYASIKLISLASRTYIGSCVLYHYVGLSFRIGPVLLHCFWNLCFSSWTSWEGGFSIGFGDSFLCFFHVCDGSSWAWLVMVLLPIWSSRSRRCLEGSLEVALVFGSA